jgi:hypothetical protein
MEPNSKRIADGLNLDMFEEENFIREQDDGKSIPFIETEQDLVHDLNRDRVRSALRKAGMKGATPSEIANMVGLSTLTARKHLEELCSTREAYRLRRGKQITMYYINGRPRHEFGVDRTEYSDLAFEVCLAEGPENTLMLHLIEKRTSLLEGEQIEGGVIIPLDIAPKIIEMMKKFYDKGGKINAR